MIDLELELLGRHEEWCSVLAAYLTLHAQPVLNEGADADADSGDWLPRIDGVAGVDDEHLPRIHGKLIALGLLQFQLAGRADGVVYRVSAQGRQALGSVQCAVCSE